MDRERVASESIRSVGYDPETRTLEVEFNNNSRYKYFDVPDAVYVALMRAASKGTYINRHIKDFFDYKKIQ
ncbi:MAG TPA: KTSC domain-containing protein [Burkholderiales bacterium]|nr:KTSC domain-containing protein [Burkholderiales bacterium]